MCHSKLLQVREELKGVQQKQLISSVFRRENKEYTQVQLHRERKISEIWKTNYQKN